MEIYIGNHDYGTQLTRLYYYYVGTVCVWLYVYKSDL